MPQSQYHSDDSFGIPGSSGTMHSDAVGLMSQGYSTAQELRALKKFYDLIQPDVVVLLFFTGNDFEDNLRREFAYLDEKGELILPENKDSWWKQQRLSLQRWLYESSHLVFYVKNVLASRAAIRLEDASKEVQAETKEYKFAITKKLILATEAYAKQRGARLHAHVVGTEDEGGRSIWVT